MTCWQCPEYLPSSLCPTQQLKGLDRTNYQTQVSSGKVWPMIFTTAHLHLPSSLTAYKPLPVKNCDGQVIYVAQLSIGPDESRSFCSKNIDNIDREMSESC